MADEKKEQPKTLKPLSGPVTRSKSQSEDEYGVLDKKVFFEINKLEKFCEKWWNLAETQSQVQDQSQAVLGGTQQASRRSGTCILSGTARQNGGKVQDDMRGGIQHIYRHSDEHQTQDQRVD